MGILSSNSPVGKITGIFEGSIKNALRESKNVIYDTVGQKAIDPYIYGEGRKNLVTALGGEKKADLAQNHMIKNMREIGKARTIDYAKKAGMVGAAGLGVGIAGYGTYRAIKD